MSYDYARLVEKIIEVAAADGTTTQRMLEVLEECARQKPHPDWALFSEINFEADSIRIERWLSTAFGSQRTHNVVRGLWFGLVNLGDDRSATVDVYVGGSPRFDADVIAWASEVLPVDARNYLGSEVLHEIYKQAYREAKGSLGNHAEYPLALAYGAIVAIQALRVEAGLPFALTSVVGAAAGFDSGDFLFLGTLEQGHFHRSIQVG
ncbi:hypothetical protein [Paraburkholderia nemoris]|uniref:hypothetical protein n=1 Tax=Paraburkholderia nemoris TaxID=2793076 RepID=UPI001B044A73|nr:hypothetical protein [Paraburkholderia nemoris]CAE6804307.1 hypothetical protein LMG22931_05561 [Paraburkholderia nemoris]